MYDENDHWAGEWIPPEKRAKRILTNMDVFGPELANLFGLTEDQPLAILAPPGERGEVVRRGETRSGLRLLV